MWPIIKWSAMTTTDYSYFYYFWAQNTCISDNDASVMLWHCHLVDFLSPSGPMYLLSCGSSLLKTLLHFLPVRVISTGSDALFTKHHKRFTRIYCTEAHALLHVKLSHTFDECRITESTTRILPQGKKCGKTVTDFRLLPNILSYYCPHCKKPN